MVLPISSLEYSDGPPLEVLTGALSVSLRFADYSVRYKTFLVPYGSYCISLVRGTPVLL